MLSAILDLVLSKKGLVEPGQRVQTAFASNPVGLRGRLSKAIELPEKRMGSANPLYEQSMRDDPYTALTV